MHFDDGSCIEVLLKVVCMICIRSIIQLRTYRCLSSMYYIHYMDVWILKQIIYALATSDNGLCFVCSEMDDMDDDYLEYNPLANTTSTVDGTRY